MRAHACARIRDRELCALLLLLCGVELARQRGHGWLDALDVRDGWGVGGWTGAGVLRVQQYSAQCIQWMLFMISESESRGELGHIDTHTKNSVHT